MLIGYVETYSAIAFSLVTIASCARYHGSVTSVQHRESRRMGSLPDQILTGRIRVPQKRKRRYSSQAGGGLDSGSLCPPAANAKKHIRISIVDHYFTSDTELNLPVFSGL